MQWYTRYEYKSVTDITGCQQHSIWAPLHSGYKCQKDQTNGMSAGG